MDNKSNSIPDAVLDNEAPPAYNTIPFSREIQHHTTTSHRTQISAQLTQLQDNLTTHRIEKSTITSARDDNILTALTSAIQAYLSNFSRADYQKGTLILIPDTAIASPNAVPCDFDFTDPRELDQVLRISVKGVDVLFWDDEDMARRLAEQLKPVRDSGVEVIPPELPDRAVSSQLKKSSFWRKPQQQGDPDFALQSSAGKGNATLGDRVIMIIDAEEIVFRTENELGLYKTEGGWAVVVRLQVPRE